MAKKGKAKISKVKRNNQTTNKMRKQGKLRLQRHRSKVQKQKQPAPAQPEYSSDSDAASGEDWADMLDEEEQKYIMNRLAKDPQLLSSVPEKDEVNTNKQGKKRKRLDKPKRKEIAVDSGAESESVASDSDVEAQYEKEMAERPVKKLKSLLPIKTKEGVVERTEEYDESETDDDEQNDKAKQVVSKEDDSETESDSGMDVVEEETPGSDKDDEVISTVQLMAARRDTLNKEKLRIGALCSSLIESPEKKLKNFYPILYLMEEKLKDESLNLHSVRKLATLSAFEVFKDILPEYCIRHQDYSNIKLKKDTLALYKFEKELLEFYKRYLQRLEKATSVIRQKKGDTRQVSSASRGLALVALRCLCGLLVEKPNFNYSTNIAQSIVPLLGSRCEEARELVASACSDVFRQDKKGDITLKIVRLINQLVKRRGERLPASALDCLLSLNIRDVELDAEGELRTKQKLDQKHKKRIVNLSKKEKKRAKKLREVEKELLETEAQESEMARKKLLTEVTKTVFHIYFRILKTAPHSKLLTAVLNGLAKFTHVINLEYYSELVAILSHLVREQLVGPRERIRCVRTALAVLAGAGDALTLDPADFHAYLYENMLLLTCASNEDDVRIVLEAVSQVRARARLVSAGVLQALAKRLAVAALQLRHHAALACLTALHQLAQIKPVASLLESTLEETYSGGRYDPFQSSPAHCSAHAAPFAELALLARHYHPTTRAASATLLRVPPELPVDLIKLSPMQVFDQYDGSQMSFKPAVPPKPPAAQGKNTVYAWAQPNFRDWCSQVEQSTPKDVDFSQILVANKKR